MKNYLSFIKYDASLQKEISYIIGLILQNDVAFIKKEVWCTSLLILTANIEKYAGSQLPDNFVTSCGSRFAK